MRKIICDHCKKDIPNDPYSVYQFKVVNPQGESTILGDMELCRDCMMLSRDLIYKRFGIDEDEMKELEAKNEREKGKKSFWAW